MQFKITLQCLDPHPALPLSYQYELSAWIYRVIENADAGFAAFLHQKGYQTPQRKSFKLFCFSQLDVPRRRVEGGLLYVESPEVSLLIGFYLDRMAEEFVRGLFQSQRFTLGDRYTRASFSVKTVEMRLPPLPPEGQSARIRTRSPLVVARKREGQHDEYLHPDDADFGRLLLLNLTEKYRAATGHALPEAWDVSLFRYRRVGSEPKSKLITIKSGKAAETRVRGWLFDFEVLLPRELLELGLLAGWGRMNGEGFGFGEVV
ncbi:MAG TPA: CRISPR-associated endoribonuclease Cas6 [Saprospiraceae bacterium]|nr:CRISPR-associated endoribonuclease Cas6 [Saprospiraceae bacterium]